MIPVEDDWSVDRDARALFYEEWCGGGVMGMKAGFSYHIDGCPHLKPAAAHPLQFEMHLKVHSHKFSTHASWQAKLFFCSSTIVGEAKKADRNRDRRKRPAKSNGMCFWLMLICEFSSLKTKGSKAIHPPCRLVTNYHRAERSLGKSAAEACFLLSNSGQVCFCSHPCLSNFRDLPNAIFEQFSRSSNTFL